MFQVGGFTLKSACLIFVVFNICSIFWFEIWIFDVFTVLSVSLTVEIKVLNLTSVCVFFWFTNLMRSKWVNASLKLD